MSNITPPNGMPKDVNNRTRGATGLDPDDPNDMAFKLVTILYFLFVTKTHFFRTVHMHLPPICLSLSRRFPLRHFGIGADIIGIVVAEGGQRRCCDTAFSECFWVGRGGEKGRWQAHPGVLGRQRCNTIINRKRGRWHWWACRSVFRVATSVRR